MCLSVSVLAPSRAFAADSYPTLGSNSIVFYNAENQPIRRVGTLPYMTSCAVAGPTSQATVWSDSSFMTLIDGNGKGKSIKILGPPREIYGDKEGYIIPVNNGPVLDMKPSGEAVATKAAMSLKKVIRHPTGGYVGVTTTGQLLHRKWSDELVANITNETAGKSISYIDIAVQDPTTFIALDSLTNEVVVMDLALREQRRSPAAIPNAASVLPLSNNSLLFVGRDGTTVAFQQPDGSVKNVKSALKIKCLGKTDDGGFYLGLASEDGAYIPIDYHSDYDGTLPAITYDSLLAIIIYSLVGSILFVWMWRRISRAFLRYIRKGVSDSRADILSPSEESPSVRGTIPLVGFIFLAIAAGGLYLSWRVEDQVRVAGSLEAWGLYFLGATLAAASLLYLTRRANGANLLPPLGEGAAPGVRNQVSWFLLLLSVASISVCFRLNNDWEYPRTIVVTWIAAQVFALGAFTSSLRPPRWIKSHVFQVFLLCALTAFSRAYKWTECPHDTHFDFGIIAAEAVRNLLDSWNGLFTLCAGQTIGRVWLLQMSASIWAFGLDEWTIRFSSLIWSVGYVLAAYLLGRELISHRFGMIVGLLGALQHTLLGYSRLPYVIESTGPLVFCLYFLCRGLRTTAYRDWALAGLWAAWSIMSVRTCTTFPFIGAAIFIYMCVVHPRVLWRYKAHALVFAVTAAIAASPFYNFYMHGQALTHRLEGMSPLFSSQGIKTDPAIWFTQFGAGFGAILRYVDRLSWPMENLAPICLTITGSLFGCGLVLLLIRFRSLATPIILLSMAGSITLGSAVLENPPSYYHHFVGTLFVMFVVAVPIEYLFQVASRVRWKIVGGALTLAVCALTVVATEEVLRPFIRFCQPAVNPDGTLKSRTGLYSVLSLHLLHNRNNRFVAVSKGENFFDFHHATFSIFYGQFSERYDIRSPISSHLPLRPNDRSQAVEFLIMPGHEAQLDTIKRSYPSGEIRYLPYSWGNVISYKVNGEEISRVHTESLKNSSSFDRSLYELTPS